ncbi:EAL domain-containing response regulator [Trichlorobacter ammonificans]|uniref:Response regulator receiver modulated diguanylate cyclase/phosphodiesterase with PAS/PAC sensor(S) n=1 Tax=Trichlorobacter ammonificans TaxID=2916410 RepID=A0ABM9DBC8_9BACT|nr:EAL domain-containing protein [Trichlorobacter ammonificans]CAH2032501.1 Response regulator receiver modulated diguanylate cyclase/phosphodiesterase with PAS/PAC sensor(S) [Trichlorobacter ammonificans]
MTEAIRPEHTGTILVVEGNVPFGELIAGVLRSEGYRCETVVSGGCALTSLGSGSIALMVLDYTMPDMSVEDFVATMTTTGSRVPFIIMTGRDDSLLAVRMMKIGAGDFLIKDTTLLDRLPLAVSKTLQEAETARRLQRAMEALQQSEARLARVHRIARIGSWEWNITSNGFVFSNELYHLLGFDPAHHPPITLEWLYSRINPIDQPAIRKAFADAVAECRPLDVVYRIRTASDEELIVNSQGELIADDNGRPCRMIGSTLDITARIRAEEEIRNLSNYDHLTGLPNRNLLQDRLHQAIIHASRTQSVAGVLFLDLDRFKGINDSLGHRAGDLLLRQVAERLSACVRESDTLARLGGDEFVVVLTMVTGEEGISAAASKLLGVIAEPFIVEGHELYITASIGISVYPADGPDALTLMKHADLAMYRAKELDRNNFQFYSSDLNVRVMERMILESALRRALERQEFKLYYQPQVDVLSRSIVGFEALLRWYHPDLGLISPDKFVPLAEESGLIIAIGEWVLQTACRQTKAWHDAGLPPVRMAVNLSTRQFRPNLDQSIAAILLETGLEPCFLELEMTESILMRNVSENMALLRALTDMGCHLAIDDFGTGYSSLAYLKNFPLGRLKIDRSFVRDITSNPDDLAIAKIIIDMARTLRMQVTAEGVEAYEQLELLAGHGCAEMQGFLFSRPLPADKAQQLLRNGLTF